MGIGKRIREARERLKLTQEELGRKVGVTGSAITNYEKEVSHPKESVMYALLRELKVDPNYLFQDCVDIPASKTDEISHSELSHIKKYRTLDGYGKETVDIVLDREIQRVKDIRSLTEQISAVKEVQDDDPDESQIVDIMHFLTPASAGTGMIVYEVGEFENLQVLSNAYTRQADYCVTVRGNSMEPRFHDGDLVMVKEQDDIEFGEIGVFLVDGNSYIKQKGDDRLISLNKSVPDVYINSYHSFDCQGRVIGVLDPDWIIK